jgi:hypothetical protein
METIDTFKLALLLILFGVPIVFALLAGLGNWLGSKVHAPGPWLRRLAQAFQVLTLVSIPFMLMLFQRVTLPVEAACFAVWIVGIGVSMSIDRNANRDTPASA